MINSISKVECHDVWINASEREMKILKFHVVWMNKSQTFDSSSANEGVSLVTELH